MKTISETLDYPNMTCDEIINADIALSGDALAVFMDKCQPEYDASYIDDLRQKLCDVVTDLEDFSERL